ncbi:nucleotidyltransferase family protein [Lyngbya confervoides]|uniref:Nucleotidyltransferase family protein n=1 Tax=Lyngbya confervoides BDU141951 TaxID=1574623 RepID=A0ABD4T2F5_9CYAN|nr:nucleotidyltransferase family protein [Lyngbya confervoides]MCM1982878.1 nucleotidyltransferase family protein [Lyngbya confervoides BDU141951]
MTLLESLKERRSQILEIAARHGASNVRVFGSVVRGEETPESDIDFLIDYDLEKITPWFPVRLIRDLEAVLGMRVDVVTEEGLKARIREKVTRESIQL